MAESQSMFSVTFLAVSKVLIAVLVGAISCDSIPFSKTTIRDFSFLISAILLPCLTIYNTSLSVNLEVLVRCSILLFFSVLLVVIGALCGYVLGAFSHRVPQNETGIPAELGGDVRLELLYEDVPDAEEVKDPKKKTEHKKKKKKKGLGRPYVAVILSDRLEHLGVGGRDVVPLLETPSTVVEEQPGYFWASIISMSIQNTVTLPLSVLQNLATSLVWFDVAEGSAYIFVYNILGTLYLWSGGGMMVDYAKRQTTKLRLIRELMASHTAAGAHCDAFTQTEVLVGSSQSPVRRQASGFPTTSASSAAATAEGRSRPEETPPRHSDASSDAETMTDMHDVAMLASLTAPFVGSAAAADVSTAEAEAQIDVPPMSPTTMQQYLTPTPALAELLPYDWATAGLVRVFYASQMKEIEAEARRHRWARMRHSTRRVAERLLTNVPLMSVVVGLVIGITTPVRNLFFGSGYLVMLMDAVFLIGNGSIPASLLLLGANLMGSTSGVDTDDKGDVRLRDSEQNTEFPLVENDLQLLGEDGAYARWYNAAHADLDEDEDYDLHASFSLQQARQERQPPPRRPSPGKVSGTAVEIADQGRPRAPPSADAAAAAAPAREPSGLEQALSLAGVSKKFVWGVIVARLFLAPLVCFVVLVAMIKGMPFLFGGRGTEDKTLLLVLFSEVAAPTAINSSLLFNQREFMTFPYAKMLFFQYVLCTITTVVWTTFGLYYIESMSS